MLSRDDSKHLRQIAFGDFSEVSGSQLPAFFLSIANDIDKIIDERQEKRNLCPGENQLGWPDRTG